MRKATAAISEITINGYPVASDIFGSTARVFVTLDGSAIEPVITTPIRGSVFG
jgi:hypothetical protein